MKKHFRRFVKILIILIICCILLPSVIDHILSGWAFEKRNHTPRGNSMFVINIDGKDHEWSQNFLEILKNCIQ